MLSVMLQRDSCLPLRPSVIEIRVLKIGSDQKEIWPVIQTCIITVVADITEQQTRVCESSRYTNSVHRSPIAL
jgi:hypothetical protein